MAAVVRPALIAVADQQGADDVARDLLVAPPRSALDLALTVLEPEIDGLRHRHFSGLAAHDPGGVGADQLIALRKRFGIALEEQL
jgi:hypothetical protein